jgi:hypothetical protein
MFFKGLSGTAVIAVTAVLLGTSMSGRAAADPAPPPPPPLPDVLAFTPISPVEFTVMGGNWYAWAGPDGITCVINRQSAGYGCAGPLPGAPDGANLVSGGLVGPPTFAATDRPIFAAAGEPKPLPPNTRLSFREISCGADDAGAVTCVNIRDQVGFTVGPSGTFINAVNPFTARPEGANPYLPGLPPG